MSWSVPSNVTAWWEKDGNWVEVATVNDYKPTGQGIKLLIEGVNVGASTLSASFTPKGGRAGTGRQALTVYSPIKIDDVEAQTVVDQISNAAKYTISRNATTNEIWVDARATTNVATWQAAFRTQFDLAWLNSDTTRQDGVTTYNAKGDATPFGSHDKKLIDAGDTAALAAVDPKYGAAVLIHELVEGYYGQIKGMPHLFDENNPDEMAGGAHTEGIKAENAVVGQQRLGMSYEIVYDGPASDRKILGAEVTIRYSNSKLVFFQTEQDTSISKVRIDP